MNSLRKIIRTILFEQIEEAYPPSFSMQEFKDIKSFRGKLEYADKHLQKLASGSSRTAYKIDDEKVLKVAKNVKGIAQNRNEADWYKQEYDIIAKTFDSDENDYWIEMELAKKLSKNRFEEITGVSIEALQDYLRYISFIHKGYSYPVPDNYDEIEENPFVSELMGYLADYGLLKVTADYGRLSSFGEVTRNGRPAVVLIDFGIDEDVLKTFYKQ